MSYAYHTGVVDTTLASIAVVGVVSPTPSRQQDAYLILKNDNGTTTTPAVPIVSPHQPAATVPPNTAKGTTGANILNGSGK